MKTDLYTIRQAKCDKRGSITVEEIQANSRVLADGLKVVKV